MSTLHALVLGACADTQENIFDLTGWSIGTTRRQIDCFIPALVIYFLDPQLYVVRAIAPLFAVANPLSSHQSQYHVVIVFVSS